jgi:hypothetical protein
MTEEELQAIAEAIADATIEPIRELLDQTMTIIERLSHRVEVLELEQLHRASAPDCTPKGDG